MTPTRTGLLRNGGSHWLQARPTHSNRAMSTPTYCQSGSVRGPTPPSNACSP